MKTATRMLSLGPTAADAPARRAGTGERAVGWWLLFCCAMIFLMVVIGGVTRLTLSGLSITEWQPVTGILPPMSQAAWATEFEKYQAIPQYRQLNFGMTLAEFKSIYFWEYLHRLWGRLIGFAYALPLIYFVVRRQVPRRLVLPLAGIFLLGFAQGALGWYMVKSGLADRVEVSQYRLVAHLALALAIYAVTLWIALGILEKRKLGSDRSAGILPAGRPEAGDPGRPDRTTAGSATSRHPNPPAQAGEGARFAGNLLPRERRRVRAGAHWRRGAEAIIALVALTIVAGGFVAGLKAGLTYNTFPLMDGRLVPAGYAQFQPFVLNWFENVAAVQFNHRLLAETTAAGVLILWLAGQRAAMPHPARLALHALFAAAVLQFALGVSTLLLVVPVPLGAAHQAGAVLLLTTALVFRHALRLLPRPVRS